MTSERWKQVESLFHAALAHDGEARQRFLDRSCDGDPALRAEVASLLDALDAPTAIDSAAASRLARELASEGPAAPGRREIGPYRLLGILGEGGMGTVYLAEQSEPLPRRVAIKIPHGVATGEALQRFELEQEALARMSHPAIAQVFDAGTTGDDQPFVVLEYVDGEPITEYCDARCLDLRRRIVLLLGVCDGVSHAHAKAVIHCDLKPSNVLVGESGGAPQPKIIDFGIAKALEPWSDRASARAQGAGRAGSFSYMSPEARLRGGPAIDTRTDVYALGVILSELIAGVRPVVKTALDEPGRRRAGDAEAPRPSRRLRALPAAERREIARRRELGDRVLMRSLRPELDWIVLRATAFEADERYGSVRELADDLERWLEGRPIEARPASAFYRAGKLLRRHAALSAATFLLAASVLAFGLGSSLLYARAEAARQQAEGLVTFMLDDLSAQLEPIGRLELLESVSRRSLAYYEAQGDGGDGDGPAAALRQIGQVLASRGDLEEARDAFERARRLDEERLQRRPSDPWVPFDLASDLGLLGRVHLQEGELRRATESFAAAESHLRQLIASGPNPARARLALAERLVDRAEVERRSDELDAAGRLLEESIRITEDLLRTAPDDPAVWHAFGDTQYAFGLLVLQSGGDVESAIQAFEAGVEVYRRLVRSRPAAVVWRYRLAVLLGQGLSSAYHAAGHLPEAQRANHEALELLEGLVLSEPENGRHVHALGWELVRRGDLAQAGGDLAAAAGAFDRAAGVQAELVERSSRPSIAWLDGLAMAADALAEVQLERGALTDAKRAAEDALDARRRIPGDEAEVPFYRTHLAAAGVLVGELRARTGDAEGARRALEEAAAVLRQVDRTAIEEPDVLDLHADTVRRLEALRRRLG